MDATPLPSLVTRRHTMASGAAAAIVAAAGLLAAPGVGSLAQGEAIRLSVAMGHHRLTWQGAPNAPYTVRLSNPAAIDARNPEGEKAFVDTTADASGVATVLLHFRTNDLYYRPVEPGDRLEVALLDGPTLVDIALPEFGADATDDGRRVVGRAAAGSPVTVTLEAGAGPPLQQAVVADDDGAFALDLANAQRLAEGAGGTASFVDAEGHRYTDVFARRHVELTMDSAYVETRASQQAPVGAERIAEVSGRQVLRRFAVSSPTWEGLAFDGRRVLNDDAAYRVGVGDVVTFTQRGGPLRRADALTRTLPDLSIRWTGDGVAGRAPADATVVVTVGAPGEAPRWSATATADAAGDFALTLPGDVRPAAGWWSNARLDTGDGIWLRATNVVPRVEASVGAGHVGIDLQPFQPVTVTVTGAGGEIRYEGSHRADVVGRLDVQMLAGARDAASGRQTYVALRPGDRMAIDLDARDPLVFTIPALVARSDPDAEAIFGTASANGQLEVALVRGDETLRRTTRVDADGRWRLDLAGAVDVESDAYARVDWLDRGHRFYAYTAPRSIRLWMANANVESWPFIGYPMAVTRTTSTGRIVGSAVRPLVQLAAPDLAFYNFGSTRDRFDAKGLSEPDDLVTVTVGNDTAAMAVALFDVRAHAADDLILGRTVPGGRVQITTGVDEGIGETLAEVVADANGAFRHAFAGAHDIAYHETLFATLQLGRHRQVRQLDSPGLTLNLSSAVLEGTLEPNVTIRARVGEPDAPEATGGAVADAHAAFVIDLVGLAGRVPTLSAGLPVAVEAPEALLNQRLDWIVPDVAFEDGRAAVVVGHAPPGALVHGTRHATVLVRELPSRAAEADVIAGVDGRWEARLGQPPLPGWMTSVLVELPDGHRAARRDVVPIVRAHLATPQVCGIGMPREAVHMEVRDATGAQLGTAAGATDRDGWFDLRLADADGAPRRLAEGDRLSVQVGGERIGLTLGPLADVSIVGRSIGARVLPNASVRIAAPARGCRENRLPAALDGGLHPAAPGGTTIWLVADDDGRIGSANIDPDRSEHGISIAVFTPSGQSYMGTYLPTPFGTAFVDSDRVDGLAAPGAHVAVRVEDAAGAVLGTAMADAAAGDGRFMAALRTDDGAPVTIAPGQWAVIEAGVGEARFEVEPLTFDFSPERGLDVVGPPERPIVVQFSIGDRREVLPGRTGPDGRFAFRPDEVPPRGGWALADVTALEVLLAQPGDNATGYAWSAERRAERTLWLPWGER